LLLLSRGAIVVVRNDPIASVVFVVVTALIVVLPVRTLSKYRFVRNCAEILVHPDLSPTQLLNAYMLIRPYIG